jgi:glycosyltransferase involved in cell wall biosynthesis
VKPLSFLMLTTFYPPYNFGGDGIGIQRLSRGLVNAGHKVTIVHDADAYISLAGREPNAQSDEPDGLEVISLRSTFGKVSNLLTQQTGRPVVHGRQIQRIIEDGDYDVINFHNISLVGGPGILKYGKAIKLYMAHEHWLVCESHVLWRHGVERCDERECLKCVVSYKRPPQIWRRTGYLERELKHVDTFIAMSEFSKKKHAEFGFPRPMTVMPYFLPDLIPGEAKLEAAPHPRPYFLFVGRLEKIKGLDDVIPVFKDFEHADLVIAGDGEYTEELKQIAADNERVRFLGRVSPDELKSWYASALALIVPSVCYETFGIILIESFRQGTPVIARRLGPFPEIVESAQAGRLFESAEELLDTMKEFRQDPQLRSKLGEAGREAFTRQWSESAVIPRYLKIIRDAAVGRDMTDIVNRLEVKSPCES